MVGKYNISILLPSYNNDCTLLVEQLRRQCESIGDNLTWEIIVADDGSTNKETIAANRAINSMTHCLLIERGFNSGRAAIRNFLAKEAKGEHLLFIDSDMKAEKENFIEEYLKNIEPEKPRQVICGGVNICKGINGVTPQDDGSPMRNNLRYIYELTAMPQHTADKRKGNEYGDFHTANFLAPKEVMLTHPFDENFKEYGYEDVLFGKHLKEDGIRIQHIDNPVSFSDFESNGSFVSKTETSLRTLHNHRRQLKGYARIDSAAEKITNFGMKPLLRLLYRIAGKKLRENLTSEKPCLKLFNIYKLLYYISLPEK